MSAARKPHQCRRVMFGPPPLPVLTLQRSICGTSLTTFFFFYKGYFPSVASYGTSSGTQQIHEHKHTNSSRKRLLNKTKLATARRRFQVLVVAFFFRTSWPKYDLRQRHVTTVFHLRHERAAPSSSLNMNGKNKMIISNTRYF